jgi:hypothetical protein
MNIQLAMLAAIWGDGLPRLEIGDDFLDGVDIDKEYDLICQKKSKLTASQRRAVEYRYHRIHNAEAVPRRNDVGTSPLLGKE